MLFIFVFAAGVLCVAGEVEVAPLESALRIAAALAEMFNMAGFIFWQGFFAIGAAMLLHGVKALADFGFVFGADLLPIVLVIGIAL